jgi:hypothetical protein
MQAHLMDDLEMAMSYGMEVGTLSEYEITRTAKITPPSLRVTPQNRYLDMDDSPGSQEDSEEDQDESHGHDMLTPLAHTGREQGGLHTATRVFLSKFGPSWSEPITVKLVSEELSLPVTDIHSLLAVLEVLEVCFAHALLIAVCIHVSTQVY